MLRRARWDDDLRYGLRPQRIRRRENRSAWSHGGQLTGWHLQAFGLVLLLAALLWTQMAHAGGPVHVAGVSGFNPGVAGTPLTWGSGQVSYYTDRGNLSAVLPQDQADALVANAFSRWTSITTAAVAVAHDGQLAEDVSGTNVVRDESGTLEMPADIQPGAGRPLAIVYDADGSVVSALLGGGAGSAELCSTNAVIGGPDSFTADGHIGHALIVINGNCAASLDAVPDLRYRLVRMLGRVLGLDWSQLNDNLITGSPPPRADDYDGFPVMHPLDILCGGPVSSCIPNPETPKMDDRAALSRLYPVTAANAGNFPGKQVLGSNTARLRGSILFSDARATGMQGVNVVARMLDPITSRASRASAASCVSGFLFRGDAGNPVTGFTDAQGQRLDHFGSDDTSLQGFFDLGGLGIPDGYSSVRYQLSVEALNPVYLDSTSVGPYTTAWVQPSGSGTAVVVTVSRGSDVSQNITMMGSQSSGADSFEPNDFASPTAVPSGGSWVASLTPYGDVDYYYLEGRANRAIVVEVTALDATGGATTSKVRPVLGIWDGDDPPGSAAQVSEMPFQSPLVGTSRLVAAFLADTLYKIGIADQRGDGRPDYRYQAHVLYADTVTPARSSVLGGTALTISGVGFRADSAVKVGGQYITVDSLTASQIVMHSPAGADGPQDVEVIDPNGDSLPMPGALTIGAAASDQLQWVVWTNPPVPVGSVAPNPLRVRVLQNDGTTPVVGATVTFTSTLGFLLSPCAAITCAVVTDGAGEATTSVTATAEGAANVTATLPSGTSVVTTVVGSSAALAIAMVSADEHVAQGSNASMAVTVKVLKGGVAQAGRTVRFSITLGRGALSSSSAVTAGDGQATSLLSVSNLNSEVRVAACVAPDDAPCTTFTAFVVDSGSTEPEKASGDGQVIHPGESFQPVVVRVTNGGSPASPVVGAAVTFTVTTFALQETVEPKYAGETVITRGAAAKVLSSSRTVVSTGAGGTALEVATGGRAGLLVNVQAVAPSGAAQDFRLTVLWSAGSGSPGPSRERGAGLPSAGTQTRILTSPKRATSSSTSPPSRSRSCTRAGCSAVSRPSALRRGSRASLRVRSASAE